MTGSHTYSVTEIASTGYETAIRERVLAIPGVTGVEMTLVVGGVSTVEIWSQVKVSDQELDRALTEAGAYEAPAARFAFERRPQD